MKPLYVPIFKPKQGEFKAVTHLVERVKQQIVPLFDVPQQQDGTRVKPIESYLNGIVSNIANVMNGKSVDLFQDKAVRKPIFIDLFQWAPNSQTTGGEHVMLYLCNRLEHYGVIVNPVIRYDFFHDPVYVSAISSIRLKKHRNYCIRLGMEHDTVQDVKADPDYVAEQLQSIAEKLLANPCDIYLLIDFHDISSPARSIEKLLDEAKQVISLAQEIGFSQFILAGASMPMWITDAVEEQNSSALVVRKEMIVWQTLLSENTSLNVTFSDYGVRNPNSPDGSKSFSHTNGKIRYTIDKNYFVVRGHQLNPKYSLVKDGFQQFCSLAQKIISSGHYMGEQFSWGDTEIVFYSNPDNNQGNQEKWISIDTNHHIETVVMELLEFRQELIAKAIR